MTTSKTLLKKDIALVGSVITELQAKQLLITYQVVQSFSHFYETYSHIYLVGKDICAVMAKHFPSFTFKTRNNLKTRHGIGDEALSDLLNELRRGYRVEKHQDSISAYITSNGLPTYTKSTGTSPISHLIDSVFDEHQPVQPAAAFNNHGFTDLFE